MLFCLESLNYREKEKGAKMDIEGITKEFPEFFYENGEPTFFDFSIEEGWIPMLRELLTEFRELKSKMKIRQIKEKYGQLRVYGDDATVGEYALIDTYCTRSMKTCEICGQEGKLRKTNTGWFYTSCEEHVR